MTTARRVERESSLYQLLTTLPGGNVGARPACQGKDPELFFPERGQTHQIAKAKAVCGGCPVRQACLRFALNHGVTGVWGGTTEEERAATRRGRRAG